jgi:hypothetical protein
MGVIEMNKYTWAMLFTLTILSHISFAQSHINSWFKVSAGTDISTKLKTDIELQYRRQNGFNNKNPLDKELLHSIRPWLYYHLNKNIRFEVSPLAYYTLYSIIQAQEDEDKSSQKEYRSSVGIVLTKHLTNQLVLGNRVLVEYRNLSNMPNILRNRDKLSLNYNIKNESAFSIYEELLINVFGTKPEHFFDHARLNISFIKNYTKCCRIEFGYMYVSKLPSNSTHLLQEHNLLINLSFHYTRRDKKI